MDTGLRFAAIDIGSNAIRLLFARIIEDGNDKPFLIKESLIRMPLRLGQDVFIDGEISAINSEKFLKTLNGFKDLINAYEPISYRACATAAMRNAKNGQDLVASVKLKTNIKIGDSKDFPNKTLFFKKGFNRIAGNKTLEEQLVKGLSEQQIRKTWQRDLDKFKKIRKNYLIYP